VQAIELAAKLGCSFEGPPRVITGAATLEDASESDLAFVNGRKFFEAAQASSAGCVIVPLDYDARAEQSVIRGQSPRELFARALALLYPARVPQPGVHPTAYLLPQVAVEATAEIGAHCTVDTGSVIGAHSRLGPGCHIGRDVHIGSHCILHAGVTVYDGTRIGDRVILHSGCVLGADGFGFTPTNGQWMKFPQVGIVEIEDDVEIGANSCVDRAALGRTRIGAGTKIDNMVHVGHHCNVGKNVVIAAQTGLSGGVVIGDGAIIGGQVGIGDKARIEPGAVVGSGSGILTSKIVRAGEPVWGTPARPLKQYLRQLAALSRIGKQK
jgi:UDP-3-O-[3-hydroxymyristoyl] glucosamine N-acyltransferase